jgi:hypothetical protein
MIKLFEVISVNTIYFGFDQIWASLIGTDPSGSIRSQICFFDFVFYFSPPHSCLCAAGCNLQVGERLGGQVERRAALGPAPVPGVFCICMHACVLLRPGSSRRGRDNKSVRSLNVDRFDRQPGPACIREQIHGARVTWKPWPWWASGWGGGVWCMVTYAHQNLSF